MEGDPPAAFEDPIENRTSQIGIVEHPSPRVDRLGGGENRWPPRDRG